VNVRVAQAADATTTSRLDLWVALAGLCLLLVWDLSGLDLVLTRAYGSRDGFAWRDAWLTSALLHDGGRALAWGVMALLLRHAIAPGVAVPQAERRERWYWIAVTVTCLLLVPALKRLAESSCPWDLAEFGGHARYVPHWMLGVRDGGPGRCFPSGHAVAAFAFLSLYFGWRTRRRRAARLALAGVCVVGALFGWAQLARGAHFASHTLWSAWLCWVVCALAARRSRQRAPALSVSHRGA
jgi:membrane-associated PAP2 superfamily phosphatase